MSESLLPPNATPLEIALEQATARLALVPVERIATMQSPQNCPLELLPWLAWAFSVDEWDDTWTEEQKRATVAASYEVHRHKGTIGAVKAALASLGIGATIVEWFELDPPGDPYTFRIAFNLADSGVTQTQLQRAVAVVMAAKNLRSHLDTIDLSLSSKSTTYHAACSGMGINLYITSGAA